MSSIWLAGLEKADEVFLRARKSFRANRDASPCILRITCSGRYRLWLNGVPILSGPAHSGTAVKRVDEFDLSGHLREGDNLLAVQLIHFRYFTAHAFCPEPAFWCSLQGWGVESDTTWRMSRDEAFLLPSFRRNLMYGPQEIYDGRLEERWQSGDYDDSHWPQAIEVPTPWAGREIARGIPFIKESDVRSVAVSRIAEVVDQEHFPQMWNHQSYQSLAVTLLQDVPEEPSLTVVSGAANLVEIGEGCMEVVQPLANDPDQPERRCATVIFDFDREINGYAWLDVEGNGGAMVDMVYGELITAGRVQAMRQGTHYADRYILREGRQRHRVYDWKGFRYLQLTFRNLTRPLLVHGVGADFCTYPVELLGSLECGDPLIEKIWATGAYTQQLCLHDRLMDCPWREQVQWLGDGRVQLLVIQNAFGDARITRKFIEDFAHSQYENGFIPSISNPENGRLDIVDYSLWWLVALHDVALWDDDRAWVGEMLPHAEKLAAFFEPFVNAEGLIENIPGWVLIDWAPLGRAGCIAPLNAIYYLALCCLERLNRWLGCALQAERSARAADRISGNFHRTFWSEENGFYRDCVSPDDPVAGSRYSQHTQALAVLSGLSRVDNCELLKRTLEDRTLAQTSPFFSFYLLEALGSAGMAAEGLDFIREKWGRMIAAGATTFWEEWQTGATYRDGVWAARPRSLCHAWSAAPTAWISRHVLGIRRETPDGKLIFAPNPCGMSIAQGRVPTRHGVVHVAWSVREDGFHAEVTLPPRCPEAEFFPPAGFPDRSHYAFHKSTDAPSTPCRETVRFAG
ncbi:MAG: hypothetical protein D4R65_07300 [Verrucomicrobiaceae bacterium]|nr:MAG: hypothetical protein D4R65_07300 [Verrucomicrobiaceae bacterium]